MVCQRTKLCGGDECPRSKWQRAMIVLCLAIHLVEASTQSNCGMFDDELGTTTGCRLENSFGATPSMVQCFVAHMRCDCPAGRGHVPVQILQNDSARG